MTLSRATSLVTLSTAAAAAFLFCHCAPQQGGTADEQGLKEAIFRAGVGNAQNQNQQGEINESQLRKRIDLCNKDATKIWDSSKLTCRYLTTIEKNQRQCGAQATTHQWDWTSNTCVAISPEDIAKRACNNGGTTVWDNNANTCRPATPEEICEGNGGYWVLQTGRCR